MNQPLRVWWILMLTVPPVRGGLAVPTKRGGLAVPTKRGGLLEDGRFRVAAVGAVCWPRPCSRNCVLCVAARCPRTLFERSAGSTWRVVCQYGQSYDLQEPLMKCLHSPPLWSNAFKCVLSLWASCNVSRCRSFSDSSRLTVVSRFESLLVSLLIESEWSLLLVCHLCAICLCSWHSFFNALNSAIVGRIEELSGWNSRSGTRLGLDDSPGPVD